jgi:hypothetical protein
MSLGPVVHHPTLFGMPTRLDAEPIANPRPATRLRAEGSAR